VTLQLLWHEYNEVQTAGYSYSQYCELYRQWWKKLSVSMLPARRWSLSA